MARRSWRVGPDMIQETLDGGSIAVVSRQAQIEAIADAVTCCDRLGGTILVLYGRAETGLPNEMATTELIVTWQDRADAKAQREEAIVFEPGGEVRLTPRAQPPDEVDYSGAEEPAVIDGVVHNAEDGAALTER